jgi:glycosyltransferase involved in cell wall biosynthesis
MSSVTREKSSMERDFGIEVLDSLPAESAFKKSISNDANAATNTILAIYHLQGMMSAGFRKGLNDLWVPNYAEDLGSRIDGGGQTIADAEKLWTFAKGHTTESTQRAGIPSIMFAMSTDHKNPHALKVMRHNLNSPDTLQEGDSSVVYLPFQLFKDAGIKPEEMKFFDSVKEGDQAIALVPKEVTMRHREQLYPLIAKASVDFMREHIVDFNKKDVVLDGNYIDGGQAILHAQDLLHTQEHLNNGQKRTGTTIAVWTPHTLALEKCGGLAKKYLETIESFVQTYAFNEQEKTALLNHPYLTEQRAVVDAAARYDDPASVIPLLQTTLEKHEEKFRSFSNLLRPIVESIKQKKEADYTRKEEWEKVKQDRSDARDVLTKGNTKDVAANTIEFSFIDRMTMESAENLKKFDAIVSVGKDSVPGLQKWVGDSDKVTYIRNGFNREICNPDAMKAQSEEGIVAAAQMLTAKAYAFGVNTATLSGVDADALNDRQHERLKNGTTFISISRPDNRKGSDTCIKAFVQWLQSQVQADDSLKQDGTLILGAHKPETTPPKGYTKELVDLIQQLDKDNPTLNLKERILLLPSLVIDQSRVLYGLPKAVGLCPSLSEPFGLVGLEATGSGIPVIASDKYQSTNEIAEKMQNHGQSILKFAAGKVDKLAECMGEASLNYKQYKDAAIQNGWDVGKEYQWAKAGDEYNKVYGLAMEKAKNNIIDFSHEAHKEPKPLLAAGGGASHSGKIQQSHEHGIINF